MKFFIGIKYKKESMDLIPQIKDIIKSLGHESYCFATDAGNIENEKEMMKMAFEKIEESDVVLLESSGFSFGVGIEAGYAFAKGKKIITIVKDTEETSNTLKGVSDHYVMYKNFEELEEKIRAVL
ncbi:MAG: nucleoside 2-deoxyribosyltransferase [Candidatus Staskawiczbacteria bacterium]|jgi:nucleoside 2-deoxyribosyltransferase